MNSLLSCRPCCYQWEDYGKNAVREKNSGQVYGTASKDTPASLRWKFAALILAQPIVSTFLRMPYRVYTILRGDCIRVGYQAATKEWQLQTQRWSLEPNPTIPPPNRLDFDASVRKYAFIELIKSISKVVTYPLAIIALEFSALYGLINPNSGRALYAAVEHAWSSTQLDEISQSGQFRTLELKIANYEISILLYTLCDYLAPCMQPKERIDQRNFYKGWDDYNSQTVRSLLRQLKEMLREKQEFFENEKIHAQWLISQLQQYQENVKRISLNDYEEIDEKGRFQSLIQQDVSGYLNQMIGALNALEEIRAVKFLEQVNAWNRHGDKPERQYPIEIHQELQDIVNSLNAKLA